MRIAIDKANNLSECLIEFEVLQEFPSTGTGSRDERITLGRLTLNLSEYVEESDAVLRDTGYRARGATSSANVGSSPPRGHSRKRSSLSATTSIAPSEETMASTAASENTNNKAPSVNEPSPESQVEDGITRRYLMTDSKINSTLKVSILMIQIDGERQYVAPPLKSAPVFGGIAGMTSSAHAHDPAGEFGQHFHDMHHPAGGNEGLSAQFSLSAAGTGSASNGKLRDVYEMQDMYRRSLAASWACQPGELPANECIEDIFAGGDGFGPDGLGREGGGTISGDVTPRGHHHGAHHRSLSRNKMQREDSESFISGSGGVGGGEDFLRPEKKTTPSGGRKSHARQVSGDSGHSGHILRHDRGMGKGETSGHHLHQQHQQQHHQPSGPHRPGHRRDSSKDSTNGVIRSNAMRGRSESLVSLAATIESERGRSGFKSARELAEYEVRDDMVAWKLPGTAS